MDKSFSLRPRTGRFSPWLAALLGIVAIKAVLSLSVKSVPFAFTYSGISYLLLLLLATCFSIQNSIHRTLRARRFWLLLAAGCGLWAFHQFLDLYYELGLHIDVPNDSIADEVLFLHLAPLSALATLPNLHVDEGKQHRWILNALLILCFWAFLYGFVVAPYKYVLFSPSKYGARYDILYLVENLVLILMLGVVALRARTPWKMIYLHLLGASALYALSSTVANIATDAGGYISGKLYGFGLTASVCWFVWIPLSVRVVPKTETTTLRFVDKQDSQVSRWAMPLLVMISIPMAWELFHRDENASIRALRLFVATAAIVLLAGGAYLEEYLNRRELACSYNRSEERLRLALRGACLGAFERDVQTGRITWSEGLESLYGLSPGSLDGKTTAHLKELIDPTDYEHAARLLENASKTGQPAQGEWRAIWPDGSVHWIAGRWQVLMDARGEPSRVVGVNLDITERKQTEEALRESEQRLRLATRIGRMYAYEWDVIADVVTRTSEHVQILGLTEPLRDPHHQFVDKIHPGDRQKFRDAIAGLTPENPTAEVTYRAVASDGTLVWLKSNGRGFFDEQGKLLRVIGMVADVTELKRAEESLADLSQKLIESQEEEGDRIGRELHDDICQRVALLAIQLGQLQASPSGPSDEIRHQLSKMEKETAELSMRIQQLSRELHSPTLEFLGLSEAIRSWCAEFGEKWKIEILFENHDVPTCLPWEISLNLFRVLQEALGNAAKYSGVKRFDVRLWGTPEEIHLGVTDCGNGFDTTSAMRGRGLGLKSMRERVRLLNGHLTIESKPNRGTRIYARVPVESIYQPSGSINPA